jgi:hypothetical protein
MFRNPSAPRSIMRCGPDALLRAHANNNRGALKRSHGKFSAGLNLSADNDDAFN